ncbi:hypothetical protein A2U01_0050006, partial [Trifolium medium]|nr:hypothetical protein [Trifolium medium]
MSTPAAEVEIVSAANIEIDNFTAEKSVFAVPVQSPIPGMIEAAPGEILMTKENEFTMDIHHDKADDSVQHQEPKTDNK